MLIIFIIQMILSATFGLIARFSKIVFVDEVALYISIFPYILLLFIFIRKNTESIKPYFFNKFSFWLIIPVIMLSIGLYIILSEFDNILKFIFPIPDVIVNLFRYNQNINDLSYMGIIITILSSLFKWSFYILVIYLGQLNYYSKSTSIILTSILISFSNYCPWVFLYYFILSLIILLLFDNFKSIIICFVALITFNNFHIVTQLLNIKNVNYLTKYQYSPKIIFQPLWYDVIGFVLVLSGIIILFNNIKNFKT